MCRGPPPFNIVVGKVAVFDVGRSANGKMQQSGFLRVDDKSLCFDTHNHFYLMELGKKFNPKLARHWSHEIASPSFC